MQPYVLSFEEYGKHLQSSELLLRTSKLAFLQCELLCYLRSGQWLKACTKIPYIWMHSRNKGFSGPRSMKINGSPTLLSVSFMYESAGVFKWQSCDWCLFCIYYMCNDMSWQCRSDYLLEAFMSPLLYWIYSCFLREGQWLLKDFPHSWCAYAVLQYGFSGVFWD